MEEKGLDRKDLEQSLGDKSKVSAILNRKRELSKKMIRSLHETFGIPYEILMAGWFFSCDNPDSDITSLVFETCDSL